MPLTALRCAAVAVSAAALTSEDISDFTVRIGLVLIDSVDILREAVEYRLWWSVVSTQEVEVPYVSITECGPGDAIATGPSQAKPPAHSLAAIHANIYTC